MTGVKSHPLLGEIGLDNFAPYLMNRIMGFGFGVGVWVFGVRL